VLLYTLGKRLRKSYTGKLLNSIQKCCFQNPEIICVSKFTIVGVRKFKLSRLVEDVEKKIEQMEEAREHFLLLPRPVA
jgi:hypothetical protein